jgi:PBP1b-binding outer membrane lipoprotein LpoB
MKKFQILLAVIGLTAMLGGCLEIDLSRTNGNQKDDGAATTTDTVE